jgi:indolepyruvate ferredoxin oxidoreductase alpha subunit
LARLAALARYAEDSPLNRVEWPAGAQAGQAPFGFVTGGMAYSFVREAFPEAPVFKLGMAYPVPGRALLEFAASVERLYVVEELDPFWEAELRWLGLQPLGKEVFPAVGELSTSIVRAAVARHEANVMGTSAAVGAAAAAPAVVFPAVEPLPARPPVLCPGCPHRGAFHVMRKLRLTVTGDIGCYTLGVMPPLSTMDTTICMGASIGNAIGMRRALPAAQAEKIVATIGDSTFIHSGITPLIDAVYNRTDLVVVIMDNGTTAMTGHQGNPASGLDAHHRPAPQLSLENLVRACGVERLWVVDPNDLAATEAAMRAALVPGQGPTVVITRRTCALIDRSLRGRAPVTLDSAACIACGLCFRIGCPALARGPDGKPDIQPELSVGCDQSVQLCQQGALLSPRGGER